MLEHLVLLRLKPGVARDAGDDLLARLRGLPATVPGIAALQCGWNISPERAHGFDIALRVRLQDREALAAYRGHPDHQAVLAVIRERCGDILAVDFEI